MTSDLQLPGELHVVVVDEDVGDEALFLSRERRRSLGDVRLDYHLQQRVRTPGPVPHLRNHKHVTRGDSGPDSRDRTHMFILIQLELYTSTSDLSD